MGERRRACDSHDGTADTGAPSSPSSPAPGPPRRVSRGLMHRECIHESRQRAKAARARTPARSCPFACVPRTVVPPPVHVDVRMRMDHHHAPWFREFHNIRLLTACDRVPGFGSKGFGVWVTGPVIPVNLLCVSPTRLPGDVARWLRGMWLRGMNEFALKCEESVL